MRNLYIARNAVIVSYCDAHPEKSVAQGEVNTETIERTLGTRVPIKCANGYISEGPDQIEAVCTALSEPAGVWVATGWCKCAASVHLISYVFN